MADEIEDVPVSEPTINAAEVADSFKIDEEANPPAPAVSSDELEAIVEAIGKSAANPHVVTKAVADALIAAGHAQTVGEHTTLVKTGRLLQIV
jgi:hypothetical protein